MLYKLLLAKLFDKFYKIYIYIYIIRNKTYLLLFPPPPPPPFTHLKLGPVFLLIMIIKQKIFFFLFRNKKSLKLIKN